MNGPDTSFQEISIRRRILITVGIFTVLTIVIGLYGLLAIKETNKRLHDSVIEGQEMIKTVDTGRLAQVHFKRQVQEWKDILLRGNDRRLYELHARAFDDEDRQVNEYLQTLSRMATRMGLSIPEISEVITIHKQLGHVYRDALGHYNPSDLKSAVLVDKMVRGIDREPTDKIDAIVSILKTKANDRLNASETLAKTQLDAYRSFSAFLMVLVLAGVGFGIYNARSIISDLPPESLRKNSDDES